MKSPRNIHFSGFLKYYDLKVVKSLSRIAIIDTVIDARYLSNKEIEHVNLCDTDTKIIGDALGHGTMCAMMLDCYTTDFELINIQVFPDDKPFAVGDVNLLAKAFEKCLDLNVDIVSVSSVTTLLSDSRLLYDISYRLSECAIIVGALDNTGYITLPTSYPHVIGVGTDFARTLRPGEVARSNDSALGIDVFANCDTPILRNHGFGPSNSFAVPIVVAYINNLLNNGYKKTDIWRVIKEFQLYSVVKNLVEFRNSAQRRRNDTPLVFVAAEDEGFYVWLMNNFYEQYEVQSSALSLVNTLYDVRLKHVHTADGIQKQVDFMQHCYETDLIFIVGDDRALCSTNADVEIDVALTKTDDSVCLKYCGEEESVSLNTIIS